MSGYTQSPTYGAGYGAQDQSNSQYIPPYSNQYMQPDASQGHIAKYDASMSAYAYNRALPAFSASTIASGVPPLPIYQGWNQDPMPLPPYSAPHNAAPYTNYNSAVQNDSQYYSYGAHQDYNVQAQIPKPYEQGELSEGEFEDPNVAKNSAPFAYAAVQSNINNGVKYNGNASNAGYSRTQDYRHQQSNPSDDYQQPPTGPSQMRHQSDSYSPYISPAVADADHGRGNTKKIVSPKPSQGPDQDSSRFVQGHFKPHGNGANNSFSKSSNTNFRNSPQGKHNIQHKATPERTTPHMASKLSNGRSLAEARQKAENAVLELVELKIPFHTIIKEGIREDEVSRVYGSLKLPRTLNKVEELARPQEFNQNNTARNFSGEGSHSTNPDQLPKLSLNTGTKDGEVPVSTQQATAMPPKSAAMTEKERTLQSKMEALRKSREERAQKQAAAKDTPKVIKKPDVTPITPTDTVESKPAESLSAANIVPDLPTNNAPEQMTARDIVPQSLVTKPPPSTNTHQSLPQHSIPGLFLASNNTIPGLHLNSTPTPSASVAPRKRPVAADFDDPVPEMTPYKRPFGHHRKDEPLVINVSDDEIDSDDDDVVMDLESIGDQDSPMQGERKTYGGTPTMLQSSAQLAEKVTRPFTPPYFSSAHNTPSLPVNQSRPLYNGPADLQRVESQMEILKRMIAEKEAKQRARQTPTGTSTPRVLDDESSKLVTPPDTHGNLAHKVEQAIHMQNMVALADHQVTRDKQSSVEVQAAKIEDAAEVKREEAEQKRLLLEKIAAERSKIDAKALERQAKRAAMEAEVAKLEALKAEMARFAAEDEHYLAEKSRLSEEAERLEHETIGETSMRRPESSPTEDPTQSNNNHVISSPSFVSPTEPGCTDPIFKDNLTVQQLLSGQEIPSMGVISSSYEELASMDPNAADVISRSSVVAQPPTPGPASAILPSPPTASPTIRHQDFPSGPVPQIESNSARDKDLEDALQEAARADAERDDGELDDGELDEGDMDVDMDLDEEIEASFAPDPTYLAPASTSDVAMVEEDESSEYSPVLHRSIPAVSDHELDDYEPPEATPPVHLAVESPPFSPAPPEEPASISPPFSPAPPEIAQERMDNESVEVPTPASVEDIPILGSESTMLIDAPQTVSENVQNGTGDLLPSIIGSSPKVVQDGFDDSSNVSYFAPYASPLKRFHAYRFHPEFNRTVPGGLRSKTYSHKIKADLEFCRYELAGGVCNDSKCEFQHFNDIVIQDDAVLTALGSPDEFRGEQRDKFCVGLREVLMGLRVRKIRDFNVIASEIVAHRTKFLDDSSRILPLNGITI